MKLNEIAGEQYKTDIATEKEVWELINTHCKDSLDSLRTPLVRGMKRMSTGFGVIHGEAGSRKSANTSNHYTVILDAVMPKEFPRRSASIICANWKNRYYAEGYGYTHAIIPYDGVQIGVCPERDIFDTTVQLGTKSDKIYRWNDFMQNNDISDESFPALVKDFKELLGRKDLWGLKEETLEQTLEDGYLEDFQSATTASAEIYNDGQEHEVWVGGKCIAVAIPVYYSILRGNGIKPYEYDEED